MKHTTESRAKIAAANRRRVISSETRAKMSTSQHRRAERERLHGVVHSGGGWNKGCKEPPNITAKRTAHTSNASKRRWAAMSDAERSAKTAHARQHIKKTLGGIAKALWADKSADQRREVVERLHSPESRAKRGRNISATNRARYAVMTPEQRRIAAMPMIQASRRIHKPTSLEQSVALILTAIGVPFIQEYRIGRYHVDFYVPSQQLVIEADGAFWHRDHDKDARRDRELVALGFTIIRLADVLIQSGEAEPVIRKALA